MKFLKNNWITILFIIAICFGFLYLGRCSAKKDVEGLLKINKAGTEALEKVVADLEKSRLDLDKSIAGYNESQAKALERIAKIDSTVAEIKQRIGEIPSKKVFTDLASCNLEYGKLQATATAQGELILTYEAEIIDYKKYVADAEAKELQWITKEKNFLTEIDTHKTKIAMDKALIEELTKKNRPDLIVFSAGGYYDPIKGKGGFSVCCGLNLNPVIKLAKKIF